jgi:O-antigen/teichoic acid export membrane protein
MEKTWHQLFNFRGSELRKNAALLIGGNGLAQVITVLVYPFIARLYPPSAFGQLAVIFSIHSLLVMIATGKYELAVVMPENNNHASDLVGIGLIISLIVAVAIIPVVYLIQILARKLDIEPHITIWYYLLGLSVFTAAYFQLQNGWCTRFKLFSMIISATFILNISTAIFKVLLGVLNVTDGLLYSFFMAQAVVALYLFFRIRRGSVRQTFRPFDKDMMTVARTYINFPAYNLPISLLNSFSGNLPVYFLAIYFSDNLTGQFSMAFTLLFKPLGIYNNSMYQILVQRVMELRHQQKLIWPFIRNYMTKTLMVSLIAGIVCVAFIPGVFKLYLGNNWQQAGLYCQFMLPWAILLIPAGSLAFIPNIFNRQSRALVIEIAYLILRLSALYVGFVLQRAELSVALFGFMGVAVVLYRLLWYRKLLVNSDRGILLR